MRTTDVFPVCCVSRITSVANVVGGLLLVMLLGCMPSSEQRSTQRSTQQSTQGPETASERSDSRESLEDKITFLEQYVTFDRTYEQLEYDVNYFNNGSGFPPGPSDWSIKVLAVVPSDEIDRWSLLAGQAIAPLPTTIFDSIPGDIETQGITQWTADSQRIVGIDRTNSIVFYLNASEIQRFL